MLQERYACWGGEGGSEYGYVCYWRGRHVGVVKEVVYIDRCVTGEVCMLGW